MGEQNILKIVYTHDPNWEALPWSNGPVVWALLIIMASAIMGILGGLFFSFFYAWRSSRINKKGTTNDNKTVESPSENEIDSNNDDREEVLENNDSIEIVRDAEDANSL